MKKQRTIKIDKPPQEIPDDVLQRLVDIAKGIPCMWESGGGYSNTGEATIIARKNGDAKQPIYIRRRGELACCEHALIPVDVGDFIITTNHHRGDFETQICRVEEIQAETAVCSIIGEYSRGEWTWDEEHHFLIPAVDAAWEKATCYHCREPHFIKSRTDEP